MARVVVALVVVPTGVLVVVVVPPENRVITGLVHRIFRGQHVKLLLVF